MMDTVLVVDYGSQYTQLIARRIREQNVFCEIVPCTADISALRPKAIILSGGPRSVYDAGAPTVDPSLFDLGIPVLGICYGLQLMAHVLGGKVEKAVSREYGLASLIVGSDEGVLKPFKVGDSVDVWMSHGDRIASLPPGFKILGVSDNTPYCVVADPARKLYGMQFHPEVYHTAHGADMLSAFLSDIAGVKPDWTPGYFVDEAIAKVRATVPDGSKVICGLSGGVDSAVAAEIVHRAVGDRLTCIFVDNGLLRRGEFDQVQKMFRDHFKAKLVAVDARHRFLAELVGVTDPEQKRKIIGRVFIEVFDEVAGQMGGADFLVQGTLYPDVIESVSSKGPSAVIKSHHNVGGLPERMKMKLIEPLREMFKDEARAAGEILGMPRHFVWRQPFPGPGLGIRCLGEITLPRLDSLRHADSIVDAEIRAAGMYESLWQSFCVLLPVRSVGVMGDARTYDETCAVRAVQSTDGMTADWARLPHELLARISNRIINEVDGINRVVYDISSKPPSTIEWE